MLDDARVGARGARRQALLLDQRHAGAGLDQEGRGGGAHDADDRHPMTTTVGLVIRTTIVTVTVIHRMASSKIAAAAAR
jgi:hypothetical protein